MDTEALARTRLKQFGYQDVFVAPWLYAKAAGIKVLHRSGRVLHPVTSHEGQGVIVIDRTKTLRQCSVDCWRGIAELELRTLAVENKAARDRTRDMTAKSVMSQRENFAMALALPERLCQECFAHHGYDGQVLETLQPYASQEWIETRLDTLWSASALARPGHLRLIEASEVSA